MNDNRHSILLVLPWGMESTGGVNQVVINLLRQFAIHEESEPLLLVNSWKHKDITEKYLDNQRCFFFHMRSPWDSDRPLRNALAFILEIPGNIFKLRSFLLKEKVKVINAHYPGLFFYQFIILKLLGVFNGNAILSYHGSDIRTAAASRGIERCLQKLLIKCADYIVVCSASLKDEIGVFVPASWEKLRVVHNGIDTEAIVREKLCAPCIDKLKTSSYLLSIATYEEKKGLDVLIKAFSIIAKENNDMSLVLVGRSTPYRPVLDNLIKELNLEDRVHLIGELPHGQATAWLERAEIFILPSRYEPFGIVLLEAGLFNIPVVASSVGGITEIIIHNENGLLVEPEDFVHLSEAIKELLASPDKRMLLGQNLRKRVLDNFTWSKAYERYVQLM